ncbi:hypothetical protein Misp06_04335 [Microbulbifer sp. NBRC 101763]|uniref:hypothetical protein n=1 Tax=Microbulbifer sp. NBRC 101763 TaxID=1113820 RepID=UPI0030B5BFD8
MSFITNCLSAGATIGQICGLLSDSIGGTKTISLMSSPDDVSEGSMEVTYLEDKLIIRNNSKKYFFLSFPSSDSKQRNVCIPPLKIATVGDLFAEHLRDGCNSFLAYPEYSYNYEGDVGAAVNAVQGNILVRTATGNITNTNRASLTFLGNGGGPDMKLDASNQTVQLLFDKLYNVVVAAGVTLVTLKIIDMMQNTLVLYLTPGSSSSPIITEEDKVVLTFDLSSIIDNPIFDSKELILHASYLVEDNEAYKKWRDNISISDS